MISYFVICVLLLESEIFMKYGSDALFPSHAHNYLFNPVLPELRIDLPCNLYSGTEPLAAMAFTFTFMQVMNANKAVET